MSALPHWRREDGTEPRVAEQYDADTVSRILADAFMDDPMWSAWAFPRRADRRDLRRAVFRVFVEGALRYRATWLAAGETAVAMWIPPGGTGITSMQEVRLEAYLRGRLGPAGASRIFRGLEQFDSMTPSEPHYYLSLFGTDPRSGGRGLGRQLLAHNLSLIDREGAPAFLDCADDLMPLYEAFGFRRTGSVVLDDGLRSNGMWRLPRS